METNLFLSNEAFCLIHYILMKAKRSKLPWISFPRRSNQICCSLVGLVTVFSMTMPFKSKWFFVTQIVLTYYSNDWEKILKFEVEGREFAKFLKSHRTIYSNSERLEQFLVKECFFKLFLEVSHVSSIRAIIIQIGKNYWDLETCRKS